MTKISKLLLGAVAFSVAIIGTVVMYGWYVQSPLIVQIRPGLTPMQFNTAMAFALVGLSVLFCIRGRNKLARALTLTTGSIGLLTLVEYGTGLSLKIDDLFVTPFVTVGSIYPGRMAPNTAVCFLLISAATYLAASRRGHLLAIPVLLAVAVLSLALVSVGGYAVGISAAYTWGKAIPMAIHTSIAFAAISFAIIAYLWTRSECRWPDWASIVGGLSAFLMSVLIWQSLIVYENDQSLNTASAKAAGQCKTLEHDLRDLVDAIERMAAREARQFNAEPRTDWVADAAVYRRHFPSIESINLYGLTGNAIASMPPATRGAGLTPALRSFNRSGPHVQSRPLDEAGPNHAGVESFSIVVPMEANGRRVGYLVAECCLKKLLEGSGCLVDGAQVTVVDSAHGFERSDGDDSRVVCYSLPAGDARWQMLARMPFANSAFSIPITLVLIFGTIKALLLVLTTRLLGRNREQARMLLEANERLGLAIDGGNIGTWEWNVADNSVTTSAELNAQLGDVPGTLNSYAEWELRLHPNDAAQAKAVIQQCVEGTSEAYESVFRVRHANGTYRRILSRGRVYRDADGLLERMAGTHVDITQQKELEQLFQAVFNETIQFMGILSPDGTVIEANRAALVAAGIEKADVVGQQFWETPWWAHSPSLQLQLRRAIARAATGVMARFEATHLCPDGSEIVVDFSLKPVRDLAGDVVYIIPEGRDITEYRQSCPKARGEGSGLEVRQNLDDLAEIMDGAVADSHVARSNFG